MELSDVKLLSKVIKGRTLTRCSKPYKFFTWLKKLFNAKYTLLAFLLTLYSCKDEGVEYRDSVDTVYVEVDSSYNHTPVMVTTASWSYDADGNEGVVVFAKIKNNYTDTLVYPMTHGAVYDYYSLMSTVVAEDSSLMSYILGDTNFVKYLLPDEIVYGQVWLYPPYAAYKYGVWVSWE